MSCEGSDKNHLLRLPPLPLQSPLERVLWEACGSNHSAKYVYATLAATEEDILRDPYSLKNWQYYLEYKSTAATNVRYMIYERALRRLPGSYKLWFLYLSERVQVQSSTASSSLGLPVHGRAYAIIHTNTLSNTEKHTSIYTHRYTYTVLAWLLSLCVQCSALEHEEWESQVRDVDQGKGGLLWPPAMLGSLPPLTIASRWASPVQAPCIYTFQGRSLAPSFRRAQAIEWRAFDRY